MLVKGTPSYYPVQCLIYHPNIIKDVTSVHILNNAYFVSVMEDILDGNIFNITLTVPKGSGLSNASAYVSQPLDLWRFSSGLWSTHIVYFLSVGPIWTLVVSHVMFFIVYNRTKRPLVPTQPGCLPLNIYSLSTISICQRLWFEAIGFCPNIIPFAVIMLFLN